MHALDHDAKFYTCVSSCICTHNNLAGDYNYGAAIVYDIRADMYSSVSSLPTCPTNLHDVNEHCTYRYIIMCHTNIID